DNILQHNIMQERFHSEPMVRATELLLQERLPRHASLVENARADDVACRIVTPIEVPIVRQFTNPDTLEPEGQLLSNGHYSVLLTASGGGYSSCDGIAVSRWRSDPTSDIWGSYCYIRDIENDLLWSTTSHPLAENKTRPVQQAEEYLASFASDHVEYHRHDGDFVTQMDVTVTPDHNAEVRRISITNNGRKPRRLDLTSYTEVALAPLPADLAHPAFSKLFLSTEFITSHDALICCRRPRTPLEKSPLMFHVLAYEGKISGHVRYETDRSKFIGRGRDVSNPEALDQHHTLSNSLGSVLDPILSLRCRVRINPGQTIRVYFTTGIAPDRAEALQLIEHYHDIKYADRAFVRAWTHSQIELRFLQMSAEKAHLAQRIGCRLLYPNIQRRAQAENISKNKRGQAGLWAMGISGDLPILLVSINREEETDIVREVLQIHAYLRFKGLNSDLVIVNEQRGGYLQPLRDRLRAIFSDSPDRDMENRPGGVFMIQRDIISAEDYLILTVAARVTLKGSAGTIKAQLEAKLLDTPLPKRFQKWRFGKQYSPALLAPESLLFDNGIGGFTADGSEYVINLTGTMTTPAPWVNVLANPDFGCIISESGAGYTWAENCHEHRLTPWSNDPVCDTPGEIIYIRDEETGTFWTPTPAPIRDELPYQIRHGQGYTTFEHSCHGCRQHLTVFVPTDCKVKIYRLLLRNDSGRRRNLSVTGYIEWVLGTDRQFTRPFVVTDVDNETSIQTARNSYQNEVFSSRVAFMDIIGVPTRTFTGDRTEFVGRNGHLRTPSTLTRFELTGRVGAGYDPCAAAQVKFALNPDEEKEIIIVIGEANDLPAARALALRFRAPGAVAEALTRVKQYWNDKLNTVQIKTPDYALDILINRWLIYQTMSSRMWARSGFYQSGGAYGFRDQLQDVMSLVYTDPGLTREQILRAASRQFLEGDAQHWWHPPIGAGVRTRCSDDYLWLPYVTADYVVATADTGVLDINIHYLNDRVLEPQEEDRYNVPKVSAVEESLYQHCLRALDRGITLVGENGIPLIGSGDWNDGMNLVGDAGKGESIWLGWFLCATLQHFATICERHADPVKAALYRQSANTIAAAIEKSGWDGEWYRRAYTDEGVALGSAQNEECRIDSIAQSWAVISGIAQPERATEAMKSLASHLLRPADKLILLLTPPFDKSALEPGYIKGYPVGVRENGGQYTHAGVWVALAAARSGNGTQAARLLKWLNPIHHSANAEDAEKYKVEPYAIAADIYGVAPHVGRGGWTWYTGSAAWMYRVTVESLLGLRMDGGDLVISPCIPAEWPECTVTYQYFSTRYIIQIDNPFNVNCGTKQITLDEEPLPGGRLTRIDDGRVHLIRVLLGY
ncbi:MAG: glycosyl transferase family 36, partial [bacterium]